MYPISTPFLLGFQLLEWLMQHHLDVPELYFLVTALIMGQPVKVLATEHTKFDLDRVWSFLWGAPVSANTQLPKLNVCPEGVCVLLAMVRGIVHGGECAPGCTAIRRPSSSCCSACTRISATLRP